MNFYGKTWSELRARFDEARQLHVWAFDNHESFHAQRVNPI